MLSQSGLERDHVWMLVPLALDFIQPDSCHRMMSPVHAMFYRAPRDDSGVGWWGTRRSLIHTTDSVRFDVMNNWAIYSLFIQPNVMDLCSCFAINVRPTCQSCVNPTLANDISCDLRDKSTQQTRPL